MTKHQFFTAFVAALRAQGETAVITERDHHHTSFARALKILKDARSQGDPASRSLPRALVGDEITGRFPELDYALSTLQFERHVGASNPRYRCVNLTLDLDTAQEILKIYPEPQRQLITRMAQVFADQGAAVHH